MYLRWARAGLGVHGAFVRMAHTRARDSHARDVASDAPTLSRSFLRIVDWLPVALFVTHHVVTLANVHGTSMSPTFNPVSDEQRARPGPPPPTDIVLLNKLVSTTRQYKKGDIVTLYSPQEPTKLITKRILALGGDTVHFWVPSGANLTPAPHSAPQDEVHSLAYTEIYHEALRQLATEIHEHESGAWMRITIPPNCAWVEGDASALQSRYDRLHADMKSRDSRSFGPVPLGLIHARVEFIVWPLSRFGKPQSRPSNPR